MQEQLAGVTTHDSGPFEGDPVEPLEIDEETTNYLAQWDAKPLLDVEDYTFERFRLLPLTSVMEGMVRDPAYVDRLLDYYRRDAVIINRGIDADNARLAIEPEWPIDWRTPYCLSATSRRAEIAERRADPP